jgi:formylglycine-generating enzyme required for sulfatase activity
MKATFRCLFLALGLFAAIHPAPTAAVQLGITLTGNKSVLYWPTSAATYVLQNTTNLAAPNWVTINNSIPVTVSNNFTVTVTNSSRARFFRLFNINNVIIPAGMALIPAGAFTMGNSSGDSDITDANTISVTVSAFFMDTNLVTIEQWQTVYNWATSAGYGFVNGGAAKAANHPVQTVDWYDAVKWCNARAQQAGMTPAYFTDAGLTQIYTNGETDAIYVNWTATGFRLPTEAEWEKAARGGLSGQRFPWGNVISESLANYFGNPTNSPGGYSYDAGPYYYNATFSAGGIQPFTSPGGSFPANGYGLNDMAGNLQEWCWDWYGTPYAGGTDPHGPDTPSTRVYRGGYWGYYATLARCANRSQDFPPSFAFNSIGFRCVAIAGPSSQPATPRLNIAALGGGQAQLTWSTNYTGYTLQATTNLVAANWQTVTNSVGTSGQLYSVTVGTAGTTRFFRLRSN